MVKAIALVLLASALAVAASASNANAIQWKLRPRVEYEFELGGRSLAGLPALQGQYSGVQYGGRVRVQGLTADSAIIRLEKMSWSAMHGRFQSGWWSAEPQSNATLAGHAHMGALPMPLSGAAAVARFQGGQVQSVLVSPEAKDWEVNMLQGVLGHLQIQGSAASVSTSGANSLHGRSQDQQTDQAAYRVLENGVSGRCLVQYEVSPANAPAQMSAAEAKVCAGKPYVQITKTKNFTDCEQYAEQSRGLPRCSPAGNACASLWARNSISQLIGCGSGDDMQLLQAVSSSSMQAELQTREDSRASVFSSVNMTLASVQPVRQRLPIPKDGVVLNGLGYRVAGKQANGQWGLDSNYGSSEENDDSMDSVEVVRQPSRQQQQHSSEQDDSSDNTSESSSSNGRAQHKKNNSHKKNHKSDSSSSSASSSQDSQSDENDSSDAKHKKNNSHKKNHKSDSSSSSASSSQDSQSDENDSSDAKHKNQKPKKHHDSSSEEDSSPRKHKKNHSDEDDSSDAEHKNQKPKKHHDSSSEEDSNSSAVKHKNQKPKKHYDSSSEEDSNSSPRKHKKNHSDENDSDDAELKKGKHSRKPRSAKANNKDQSDVIVDDIFAGVLSPAAVQKNATLRSSLQHRLSQDLQTAASELSRQDGPSPRSMERLSMAVRVCRALGAEQLAAVQGQMHDQTARDLFRDVLAMCGSEACVQQMVALIKDRKMNVVATQMALTSLADRVSAPSRKINKYIEDIYMMSNEQQVKIAAALAMGNLAGRAARPVAAATSSFLAAQLAKQSSMDASQLRAPLTYALGNTATSEAAKTLIKMAKDSNVAPYLRAQAILALRPCAMRSPSLVRDALLGLFHDPTESAPVRMAAVSLLVYTKPSLPLWQRLAVSTFYEPNMAVSAYVWATIHSFANLQDPAFRQQTQFARLALPLTRSMPQGSHLAFNVVASSVDAQLDRMVHEHASFMGPADAANAYYRRVTRRAGVSSLDQEVDLWGANPDDLMQAAMEAVFGREDKAAARPVAKDVPHSTRSIHDKLNIVRRRLQDPQGHLRLTLKPFVNNMFLTFDKDTPNRMAKAAAQLVDKLRSETGFHAQQMGGEEVSMATVTEMGFPVNLRIQAPWLLRAQGSAQVHRNFSAQANVTCLYSAGLSAQLSVQPSWASREYVAAVNGHAMVQIPATAVHAEMSGPSGRFSVRAQPSQPQQASVVARVALQPLTASVEVSRGELASESATAHNASMGAGQGDSVLMSLWDNVSLNLRAPVERNALPAWIRDSRTVLGFPALGRPLSASRLEVVASRAHSFNVSVALVKGMLQSGDFQVVYPDDMRQDNDEHASPAGPTSTTTETPVSSSTTEMPTTTEAATTTVTPAVVRSPRWADHSRRFHGNGSMFVDNGDMDFTRSVFNATTLNPYTNRINGSNELYVLSQVLAGMSAGRGYVVGVNVTSEDISGGSQAPAHYSGFWTVGANLGGRLMRAGLFARSDADNAQVAATAAILKDVAARSSIDAALHQQPALMIKAEYQQVDAKAVRKIVTAAMETDHSAAKTQRLWRAAKEQFCVKPDHAMQSGSMQNASVSPACRSILGSANIPDQFNLTINYNNPAEEAWGSSVHLALEAAKAYLWNQGNIAVDTIAPGNGNELGAGVTVQAGGKLDGWLQTPRTLTKVASASAPVASTLLAAANQETRAFCGATSSQLVTLDGVQGSIKMGACWHVLAKDCSGKSRVAVLARSDKAQPDDIHVEINIDNYQIARLSPDGAATLNGVAVADHSNQTGSAVQVRDAADVQVMTIVRSEDGALTIKLPDHDMSVVYGNSSVVIQAGSSLHGRLCGVCGKFDGSFSGEMLNPKNKAEKSIQALVDSYAIKDAQCGANGKSHQ